MSIETQVIGADLILIGVSLLLTSILFKTAKTGDLHNFQWSIFKMSIADQKKLGTKMIVVGLIVSIVGIGLVFI